MKTLGGVTFAWRNNDQDYHVCETLRSLVDFCDQVAIAVGGPDGTYEDVEKLIIDNKWQNVILIKITQEMWDGQQGREKLSFFSNIAIEQLTTDYFCYIQADEMLHEASILYLRMAIETGYEAFFMRRLNLWKTPWLMLDVEQSRKPVSTEVIRLAKTNYRCVDDAEQIGCSQAVVYGGLDFMQIFHMGFVRHKVKHLVKIAHMQKEVFLWGDYDEKAKNCKEFQPQRWFSDDDLIPIPRPLPKYITQWCAERYPEGC